MELLEHLLNGMVNILAYSVAAFVLVVLVTIVYSILGLHND